MLNLSIALPASAREGLVEVYSFHRTVVRFYNVTTEGNEMFKITYINICQPMEALIRGRP